ncbi:MAG: hypothetical protein BWY77_01489 [bacterium ADurb.Bin431]|nr:MAG: hypothetical protein BWY77_01489 [bacterium ADurb.Bin431]
MIANDPETALDKEHLAEIVDAERVVAVVGAAKIVEFRRSAPFQDLRSWQDAPFTKAGATLIGDPLAAEGDAVGQGDILYPGVLPEGILGGVVADLIVGQNVAAVGPGDHAEHVAMLVIGLDAGEAGRNDHVEVVLLPSRAHAVVAALLQGERGEFRLDAGLLKQSTLLFRTGQPVELGRDCIAGKVAEEGIPEEQGAGAHWDINLVVFRIGCIGIVLQNGQAPIRPGQLCQGGEHAAEA